MIFMGDEDGDSDQQRSLGTSLKIHLDRLYRAENKKENVWIIMCSMGLYFSCFVLYEMSQTCWRYVPNALDSLLGLS